MFTKILVANRGEIACRIIRTAQRLGVKCVAVFSEADTRAAHVSMADEARCIGPAASAESYLNIDRVLEAARASGAQAIHPGYGFLSENARFAEAVRESGLNFIGPPASAIRSMGSKDAAKELMQAACVPLLPGYHGEDQSFERLRTEAEACGLSEGLPVLLKAVQGGGGKGMRIVASSAELSEAVEGAQREALAAFGDGRLLVERYLARARHIEVQVMCDSLGGAVHLFERDCSVQRRHQKVLEEAPAPGVDAALRAQLGEAAVKAARAVGYEGAGTVEFIADAAVPSHFFFMEMNTRLQVEHPVTEMVSGVDLVEWQLRVAAGEPLPLQQSQLELSGHAIEARIYAERPAANFLPGSGTIRHLRLPTECGDTYVDAATRASLPAAVRLDIGLREGDEVSVFYDPMMAKLIARAPEREGARRALSAALTEWQCEGVPTNAAFLRRALSQPAFVNGEATTAFIDEQRASLFETPPPPPPPLLRLAAVLWAMHQERQLQAALPEASPFGRYAFGSDSGALQLQALDEEHEPIAAPSRLRLWRGASISNEWSVAEEAAETGAPSAAPALLSILETDPLRRTFLALSDGVAVSGNVLVEPSAAGSFVSLYAEGSEPLRVELLDTAQQAARTALEQRASLMGASAQPPLHSPMPGKLVRVLVEEGQSVKAGEPLIVLEAMKMEHTLRAAAEATVQGVHARVGEVVPQKALLLSFNES